MAVHDCWQAPASAHPIDDRLLPVLSVARPSAGTRPQADIDLPRLDAARLTLNVKSSGRRQPPPNAEIQQVRSALQD
jgi:hypothetical protein